MHLVHEHGWKRVTLGACLRAALGEGSLSERVTPGPPHLTPAICLTPAYHRASFASFALSRCHQSPTAFPPAHAPPAPIVSRCWPFPDPPIAGQCGWLGTPGPPALGGGGGWEGRAAVCGEVQGQLGRTGYLPRSWKLTISA